VDDRDRPEEEKKEEKKGKKQKKEKGQNKGRQYGDWADAIRLCNSRANSSEFSPKECSFGDRCNLSHDLRKYLKEGRREDLTTFEGKCPVFEVNGRCHAGWKCRFVGSHSKEIEHDDGRKELILLVDPIKATTAEVDDGENRVGVHNVVSSLDKLNLARRVTKTPKSDQYNEWIEKDAREMDKTYHKKKDDDTETKAEHRATFIDPPFRPSEKRRIYFGPETPVLAPLTTQGNLPFRRLCVDLGAQLTYSEMAMAFPLIQGQKSEWALMKAHESEITPPLYTSKSNYIVQGYDNSKDLKFGAQIAANKPWHALKAAEILSTLVPHLREININCGCPIDLVYRQGAGSALLDTPSKLEKMVRGMNAVSGEVPITVKIRMGTKDDRPTANKLIQRMAFGGDETRDRLGAPGCAAITLHGRSRQQRYTRSANWSYIAECAALVKSFHDKESALTDTAAEPDAQHLANGGKMFLIGNGDCYSHVDYYDHINNAGVDSVMLARGALIKPWLFEEIEKGQYLDKSASERLAYVERFVRYGLEAWGSDEMGISATRRFLLEWLSFAHRYVPIGILEHLPPSLQDRPPAYRGRNELETLLASDNYKDWIKIRYVTSSIL
jgi:tRNA-dihydrouridine synthase 3